jgi:predicted SprT family Zn-dependent metalloprotease
MELEHARELAFKLMSDFGLYYWKFKFDNAKIRFGLCDEFTKTISLSKELVLINDEEAVEQVILHEIAHALVGTIHKHNNIFQQKAREIGCEFISRYCSEYIALVHRNVVANCPKCGYFFKRYRKPKSKKCCSKCVDVPYQERLLTFERKMELSF